MFAHHIAYRFENGRTEEFVGTGITLRGAQQNGVDLIRAALAERGGEPFSMTSVLGITGVAGPRRSNTAISTRTYIAALS